MTDFILHSTEAAAEATVRDGAMLILSVRETEAFLDDILKSAEPGAVLRAAARQYRQLLGNK